MKYLLFIALGGASGTVSRYLLANWVHGLWEGKLPMGTLLVNVLGSFAIGIVYVVVVERQFIHADWRGVLMVGFLGAFTTFSTFSLETINLFEAGHSVHALLYMFGSAIICVVMAGVGHASDAGTDLGGRACSPDFLRILSQELAGCWISRWSGRIPRASRRRSLPAGLPLMWRISMRWTHRRKQADVDSQNLLAERKSASKKIGVLVGQGISVDDAKAQVNESLE